VTKKPTMSDIAQACGVSQATVSLVLNGAPGTRISTVTRDLVLRKAEEIGYRFARRNGDRRPIIAMLINDLTTSPHVAGLIDGVSDAANDAGYLVSVIPTRVDAGAEAAALDYIAQMQVGGIVLTRLLTQEIGLPPNLPDVPTILLNCYTNENHLPAIIPADLTGAMAATLSLIDAGHRRIGYIGGEDVLDAARERLRGYKRALATHDIHFDPALVIKGGWKISSGYRAARQLLALSDRPTAIACYCDRTAVGVYNAAADLGLSVPGDLSVVGFDNESYTADMSPPLTTVELPHADMARAAVELLLEIVAGRPFAMPVRRIKFECPLIERSSVAAPATAMSQT
jgi:LacI family transcriptional regulator